MFIGITGIDLFDQNVCMVWCGMCQCKTHMSMNIANIDLFDQNMGMVCANVRLRCAIISFTLIYLIKLGIWDVLKLD